MNLAASKWDERFVSFRSPTKVAVGTIIADRPPHGSVRAALPHTALTSVVWRQNVAMDKDAESVDEATSARTNALASIRSVDDLGSGDEDSAASTVGSAPENASKPPDCRGSHGIGNSRLTLAVTSRPSPPRPHASAHAGSASVPEVWPPFASARSFCTVTVTVIRP